MERIPDQIVQQVIEETKSMVETIEENPRGPEQFSFQDEVDALKIFGPIALKKNIEKGHHRGNQANMNKRAGG